MGVPQRSITYLVIVTRALNLSTLSACTTSFLSLFQSTVVFWEKGVLSLHGVAVGHSVGLRPVIVSCIAVDWIGGFAVQLSCAS